MTTRRRRRRTRACVAVEEVDDRHRSACDARPSTDSIVPRTLEQGGLRPDWSNRGGRRARRARRCDTGSAARATVVPSPRTGRHRRRRLARARVVVEGLRAGRLRPAAARRPDRSGAAAGAARIGSPPASSASRARPPTSRRRRTRLRPARPVATVAPPDLGRPSAVDPGSPRSRTAGSYAQRPRRPWRHPSHWTNGAVRDHRARGGSAPVGAGDCHGGRARRAAAGGVGGGGRAS